jgi:flagellar biosynthesis/type III secretory pathway M-ring protein FliF/YscJ
MAWRPHALPRRWWAWATLFLESTRGDEALYLGPWRLAQWLDLGLALAAAVGLIVLWLRADRKTEEPWDEGAEEQEGEEAEEPGSREFEEGEAADNGAVEEPEEIDEEQEGEEAEEPGSREFEEGEAENNGMLEESEEIKHDSS